MNSECEDHGSAGPGRSTATSTRSLATGKVPLDWKKAEVVPIFKKGTKGDTGNYRPVSLKSIPGKMMESILKDKMMDHLAVHDLIRESQHGFMPGKSCTTNLIVFMNKVTELVDNGTPVDIFYLDYSKAFDRVPHERLLIKLESKGITSDTLIWVRDWLTGRSQTVRVGTEKSGESAVTSGVPQGTVLGPIFFIIFIDDLDECADAIELMIKFSDDTKGLQPIRGPEDSEKLQATLDKLHDWSLKWGMSFNIPKCKIMHLGLHNPRNVYTMGGEVLQTVEEEKDIGITITKNLKPTKHCQKVAGMANSVLTQLVKNFHYRDRHVFKQLYTQYVRPHVEFASPAWSPWPKADISLIEGVQIRAVKLVSGLSGQSYEEKCHELGLDTLEKRRANTDLIQAYKILSGHEKVNHTHLFNKVQQRPGMTTRGRTDDANLAPQRSRLDIRKYSYCTQLGSQNSGTGWARQLKMLPPQTVSNP